MRDAVIVDAVRTAVGKRGGSLARTHSASLAAHVLVALADRTGLEPALVDDVVWGCGSAVGMQAGCIARGAVLAAGWPESVPGVTVDRQCGSSQQAVHQAAAGVVSGQYDIAVAGGVEVMSAVPLGANRLDGSCGEPYGPDVWNRYDGVRFHQGVGAQMIADEYGITRTEMDQHGFDSHARAAAAQDEGRFVGQIAPIKVTGEDERVYVFDTDEGVRRSTTMEALARLGPAFGEGGTITAGNASQISDGAAALLITTSELARAYGWTPMARIHTAVVAGTDPVTMLKGPIPATAKALRRSGLSLRDIGVYEINEAFASVSLAWTRATGADYARMNPLGGAMAIGHPIGGSGARIMTTMVHHMHDNGIRYGLQSMCEGGGMANATILELL
ncbi:acetyl-CoA acyltransferase [Rhodococcus wratislaviensis]|uniref:Acetyl-CoA acyltransferase n=2 Tax=Rhodococcus wratislaviensis TaxID=44752 RepID=A0AB38F6S9_RHOWR|nr:thiolase family protein [Rhodococcus wratislaviensis]REE70726.1 acetyl-CoA acyltransferase [Rhodococcus wratislaviensis]GAF45302.1 putative acetyl-CoA acyltransferase [Rhodococcus wratislaviensis NBRC 100605]SPZ34908.1 acetyl-CoA acyltransferase [Rhodococcus wratislaviensis]